MILVTDIYTEAMFNFFQKINLTSRSGWSMIT